MWTMKLLVFAGSTRQQSFNRQLAGNAVDVARRAGADVTHIELADFDIPLYNADLSAFARVGKRADELDAANDFRRIDRENAADQRCRDR